MNPPFGGKEGKEAQTPYEYKTGATQVLFLQNVLKSMKTGQPLRDRAGRRRVVPRGRRGVCEDEAQAA